MKSSKSFSRTGGRHRALPLDLSEVQPATRCPARHRVLAVEWRHEERRRHSKPLSQANRGRCCPLRARRVGLARPPPHWRGRNARRGPWSARCACRGPQGQALAQQHGQGELEGAALSSASRGALRRKSARRLNLLARNLDCRTRLQTRNRGASTGPGSPNPPKLRRLAHGVRALVGFAEQCRVFYAVGRR
jgi:hypothetical protein